MEVSFYPTVTLFFGLKMKQNKICKFITENSENNNIFLIISVVGHNFFAQYIVIATECHLRPCVTVD